MKGMKKEIKRRETEVKRSKKNVSQQRENSCWPDTHSHINLSHTNRARGRQSAVLGASRTPRTPEMVSIATKILGRPETHLVDTLPVILPSCCLGRKWRDVAYVVARFRDTAGKIFTLALNKWQEEEPK